MTLQLNETNFRPGETIKGDVNWQLDKTPKSLEVRLFWYTQGKGTEDLRIIETKKIEPKQNGFAGFKFILPKGPYSFSGKLISLIWEIEFVTNPTDDCARESIILSPTGNEILL